MYPNYRIIAIPSPDNGIIFELVKVVNTDDNVPSYYSSIEGITSRITQTIPLLLNEMKKAYDKPVLWGDTKWPQEYDPTQTPIKLLISIDIKTNKDIKTVHDTLHRALYRGLDNGVAAPSDININSIKNRIDNPSEF